MNRNEKPLISAVIIARNEAPRIADCLKSLGFCGETVVVDNGSSDQTAEIASKLGARVVTAVTSSFSALRTVGARTARGAWLLYVDADERVTPELAAEIRSAVAADDAAACYFLRRTNYYLGVRWPVGDRMQRLFRKSALKRWFGDVHETAEVDGRVGELTAPLEHFTHRDLTSMLAKTNEWSETEARLRLESGHPAVVPWRIIRVMLTGFADSYVRQGGWKAGTAGVIESVFQAFSMFVTYAKLWELQQRKDRPVR
jgi:glycosyltransferase involved in cell wall biosynthesis